MLDVSPSVGTTVLNVWGFDHYRLGVVKGPADLHEHMAIELANPTQESTYVLKRICAHKRDLVICPLIIGVLVEWVPRIDRYAWSKPFKPFAKVGNGEHRPIEIPDVPGELVTVWGQGTHYLLPGETLEARATAIAVAFWATTARRPFIEVTFDAWYETQRHDQVKFTFRSDHATRFHAFGLI